MSRRALIFLLVLTALSGFFTAALGGFIAFVYGAPYCVPLPAPNPEEACTLTLGWLGAVGIGFIPGAAAGAAMAALAWGVRSLLRRL